jgi:hypothetical protein
MWEHGLRPFGLFKRSNDVQLPFANAGRKNEPKASCLSQDAEK